MLPWAASTCQACKYPHDNTIGTELMLASYLSLSSSLMKPNALPISESTLVWATSLAQCAEVPTDSTIILLIQYQRLLGDVLDLYQEEKKSGDWSRIPLHAKRMTATLENWWLSVPENLHLKRKAALSLQSDIR